MKWIFITIEAGHLQMEEGEVATIGGGEPATGGPFYVTAYLPDKRVKSYAGRVVGIKDDILIFTDLP